MNLLNVFSELHEFGEKKGRLAFKISLHGISREVIVYKYYNTGDRCFLYGYQETYTPAFVFTYEELNKFVCEVCLSIRGNHIEQIIRIEGN